SSRLHSGQPQTGAKPMQMSEAAVSKEVQGVEEANKLLIAGWRLLDVTVKTNPGDEYQYTYFVLGRPAEPKPKEPNEFFAV
ncbi:hypothetical protein, partial [Pseudomonas sp. FW305-70]|uniref:hypothetical protein n=1 Tax=Pseudomonas sp. FW305-70 TaxID=2751342 RepID=UPI001A90E4A3